jgi:hypothetical protein
MAGTQSVVRSQIVMFAGARVGWSSSCDANAIPENSRMTAPSYERVPYSRRLGPALILAILAGALSLLKSYDTPAYASDLDQLHYAARVLLAGHDPYAAIGPGLNGPNWHWPLYYPLTAVLMIVPLAWMPIVAARAAFSAASGAALGWALAGGPAWRRAVFVSGAWMFAVIAGQWAPLFLAAVLLPELAWVAAAKPTSGLAAVAGTPRWRRLGPAIVIGAVIVAISLAAMPSWPLEWWRATRSASHIRPLVSSALGLPLLAAAIRWRRPEARLLLGLALVPQNPGIYETVLLFAIPNNSYQAAYFVLASWVVAVLAPAASFYSDFAAFTDVMRSILLTSMYLPALIMVLVRSNEGEVPAWLDRALVHSPRWLRGSAASFPSAS